MITETKLIREINLTSSYVKWLIGQPCYWDEKTGIFTLNRNFFKRSMILNGIGAFCSYFAIVYAYINSKNGIPMNVGIAAVGFFIAGGIFTTAYFSLKLFTEPELILQFNNGMAEFEQMFVESEKFSGSVSTWEAKLKSRQIIMLAELTCIVSRIAIGQMIPVVAALGSIIIPNLPMDLWSQSPFREVFWLIMKTVGVDPGMFEIIIAFIFNLIMWEIIVKCWCLLVTQVIAGCMGLSSAVLITIRKFKSGKKNSFLDGIVLYRQVQILAENFRKLVSTLLVIVLLETMCCQLIPSVLILGKQGNSQDIAVALKLFLVLAGIEGVIGVSLVFGFCADLHYNSKQCLKMLKKQAEMEGTRNKWKAVMRAVKSMPLVKVQFGSTNYIEKTTPVVFQHFTTQKIIDSLLVSNS